MKEGSLEAPPQSVDVQRLLREWAALHTERHDDLTLLDPFNPAVELSQPTKQAQAPQTTHLAGNPLDTEAVNAIVTGFDHRFPAMLASLDQHEADNGFVSRIGHGLENGENFLVAANHVNIGDLGFVVAAYLIGLRRRGFEFKSGIIVGKIAPYLGRQVLDKTVSLTDVLAYGCDDIYLGYPDTTSTPEAGIPEDLADRHNYKMLRPLLKKMRSGGNLIVLEPTGTTLKPSHGMATFGDVSSGTEGLFTRPKTAAINTAVWLENDQFTLETDGLLYGIQDDRHQPDPALQAATMDQFMQARADLLNTVTSPTEVRFATASKAAVRGVGALALST